MLKALNKGKLLCLYSFETGMLVAKRSHEGVERIVGADSISALDMIGQYRIDPYGD